MGTGVVVFLKVFFQDYCTTEVVGYLDCLAERGKPKKSHYSHVSRSMHSALNSVLGMAVAILR